MVVAQGRMPGQGGHIDRRPRRIDRRDILREGGVAEGVRVSQQIHRIGWVPGQLHRRRANAAVADNHRGDALRQLGQHLGSAYHAGIVMRVHIDEAGREHPSVSLRNLAGAVLREFPDRADEAAFDSDVGWVRFAAAAVARTRTFRIRLSQSGIEHHSYSGIHHPSQPSRQERK